MLPAEPKPLTAEERKRELWQTLGVFALATAGCAALWQLRRVVPFVASNLHALIAAIFLYLPTMLVQRARDRALDRHEASRAGEDYGGGDGEGADGDAADERGTDERGDERPPGVLDFADYGLTHRPLGRGLMAFAIISAVVFPLFFVGAYYYYQLVCGWVRGGAAMPGVYLRMCRRFVGSFRYIRWRLPRRFARLVAAQLLVVALPEEYFFRGYVQTRLQRAIPTRRRLLGAPFGLYVVVASLLFALGHVLVDFNPLRFAVFFPSLAFGWLRASTGSIVAGVLFHACCNLVSEVFHALLFV